MATARHKHHAAGIACSRPRIALPLFAPTRAEPSLGSGVDGARDGRPTHDARRRSGFVVDLLSPLPRASQGTEPMVTALDGERKPTALASPRGQVPASPDLSSPSLGCVPQAWPTPRRPTALVDPTPGADARLIHELVTNTDWLHARGRYSDARAPFLLLQLRHSTVTILPSPPCARGMT